MNRLEKLNIKCNRDTKINDDPKYREEMKSASDEIDYSLYNIDDDGDGVQYYLILKMIIAGAFYPNYFRSFKIDLAEANKTSGGHDLFNTVQIKNLPMNEGVLYSDKIIQVILNETF
jgi:hypothetical protein